MARFTILTGIVLILLGVFSFMATGSKAPTSLIPAVFGFVLSACGVLARTTDLKKRGLWMHVAVTVGLLGFLSTAASIITFIRMRASGFQVARPVAVEERAAMSVLLLVFVGLCVRNFINNRRAGTVNG